MLVRYKIWSFQFHLSVILAEPNYKIEFDLSIRQRCKLGTSKLIKRLRSIDFYLISAVSVNMRCVGMWEKTAASQHICCLHFCRCSICTENIYENYIIQYWPLYWIPIYFNLNNASAKGYHILKFFQKNYVWNVEYYFQKAVSTSDVKRSGKPKTKWYLITYTIFT